MSTALAGDVSHAYVQVKVPALTEFKAVPTRVGVEQVSVADLFTAAYWRTPAKVCWSEASAAKAVKVIVPPTPAPAATGILTTEVAADSVRALMARPWVP